MKTKCSRNLTGCKVVFTVLVGVMIFESVLGERHYHTVENNYPTNPPAAIYSVASSGTISNIPSGTLIKLK